MRGRGEEGQGGHQGEDREDQQADSVQHDGRELPVVDDERFLFTGLDCLSDQPGQWRTLRGNQTGRPASPEFLQYQGELPGGRHEGGGRTTGTSLLPTSEIFQMTPQIFLSFFRLRVIKNY